MYIYIYMYIYICILKVYPIYIYIIYVYIYIIYIYIYIYVCICKYIYIYISLMPLYKWYTYKCIYKLKYLRELSTHVSWNTYDLLFSLKLNIMYITELTSWLTLKKEGGWRDWWKQNAEIKIVLHEGGGRWEM